jgi:hypothetical protein
MGWPGCGKFVGAARKPPVPRRKYSKDAIIERLRKAAASGSDLKATSLAKNMKLDAVRRDSERFTAVVAAGLGQRLEAELTGCSSGIANV